MCVNKVLTVTDLWIPLLVHWYLMWYFSGRMSMLPQVGGGDQLTHRFLALLETWTSTGGSGFTAETQRTVNDLKLISPPVHPDHLSHICPPA